MSEPIDPHTLSKGDLRDAWNAEMVAERERRGLSVDDIDWATASYMFGQGKHPHWAAEHLDDRP